MQRRFPDVSKLCIAVVGDLVADRYVHARPLKLSREAPVLVLRHERERLGAGGAANVACNLTALGARVLLVGAVGRDAEGRELVQRLQQDGVDVEHVRSVAGWQTPTKTRVLAAEPRRSLQQVLRIDREPDGPVPERVRAALVQALTRLAGDVDAVIVSDYEYGAVDARLGALARELAARGKPVVLDPRRALDDFRGLTALTPNVDELARFAGVGAAAQRADGLDDPARLAAAARVVLERADARWLLVTRGNLGMALFDRAALAQGATVEASGQGEVTDVSGAGDTATAVFTLALAAGVEAVAAMELANAAAGVVVMEHGAATVAPAALRGALEGAPHAVLPAAARATSPRARVSRRVNGRGAGA